VLYSGQQLLLNDHSRRQLLYPIAKKDILNKNKKRNLLEKKKHLD
jgi:hypothetical protein